MSDTAIRCESLSKHYVIGTYERYRALRDVITEMPQAAFRRFTSSFKNRNGKTPGSKSTVSDSIWALDDVSFEIKVGEVVGIIGRNGAGKSTLLKILSRITKPTRGRALINGRIGSLLEVGTGFHPELTGRENIYLNGAILGIRKADIDRKFDAIVEFAEVAKFIDTPVKRYSSGMYVRLAFAVAAHMETEVLIVDEVLAVGDTQFQEKCLRRMQEVGQDGRTVLFVSHNMGAIRTLCTRALLLNGGRVTADSTPAEAINLYTHKETTGAMYIAPRQGSRPYVVSAHASQDGQQSISFSINRPITLSFDLDPLENSNVSVAVLIRNDQDVCVYHSTDEFGPESIDRSSGKRFCTLPPYALAAGGYWVDIHLFERRVQVFESIRDAFRFHVHFEGRLANMTLGSDWKGTCGPGSLSWS